MVMNGIVDKIELDRRWESASKKVENIEGLWEVQILYGMVPKKKDWYKHISKVPTGEIVGHNIISGKREGLFEVNYNHYHLLLDYSIGTHWVWERMLDHVRQVFPDDLIGRIFVNYFNGRVVDLGYFSLTRVKHPR